MFSRRPFIAILTCASVASAAIAASSDISLRFFEGNTISDGTLKVLARRPQRSRSIGRGRIEPDGSLTLVQRVEDEGKPVRERRWHIRQVAPGRFTGTMSEATSKLTVEEVSGRFRFRFKMKGGLDVEQWLTPHPGGRAARSQLTVRKLGMVVATGDSTITKQN